MKDKKKRNDLILIGVILLIAACYLLYRFLAPGEAGGSILITVYGEEYQELPLNQDTELVIDGPKGGVNILTIKDGKAYMSEASCPDKRCIDQGKIYKKNEMIVCLPNQVVVSAENAEEAEEKDTGLDGLAQ